MNTWTALGIAALLIAANAFFVAAEFALVSARRDAVQARADAGSKAAATALAAMQQVSLMMAGAQLGITLCSLGLGALGEPAVAHLLEPALHAAGLPDHLLHPLAFTIALTVVVFAHVVYGEMVPKNLTLANPERAAILLAPPMTVIVTILKPAIVTLNTTANLLLRALRVAPTSEVHAAYTRDEVAALLAQSHREGLIEPDEMARLGGVLTLDNSPVGRIMVPTADLVTVPAHHTVATAEHVAATSGYSRLPVTADGHICGYIHVKDIIAAADHATVATLTRPLATITADTDLRDALHAMRTTGAHLGVVTDRTDTVVGVVALEDILEQLVGEIRDATHR